MKKNTDQERLVNMKHISWKEYILVFLILEIFTAGQAFIYFAYMDMNDAPPGYIIAMLMGYWAFVSLIVCLLTNRQWFLVFDRPMRKLSKAARQVADGDFSVFVEPVHTGDKKDYVDVMFEDFNRMVKELGSIETLKNDFITNVSHEIKTPLSVIQSYAALLRKENLTPETRTEYAETIVSASNTLSALITNILKLNKLENQEIQPSVEPYDLCRQLCVCALSFEDLWEKKDIEFVADIEDRCVISADESMLEIVWNNLLSNALKFTEPGGRVALTQTSDEDSITVTISDTGCGMDERTMRHIFDKFYQGDTSHSGEGNGLGLALLQKVIELMDGRVTVISEPGKGSTFTVRIKR